MYDKIDMRKTGMRLKRTIKEAGYTVKDIQELLHLSCPQPVYRWYKGLVLPSVDHLYVLSKLLEVHMEDLIVSGDEAAHYADDDMSHLDTVLNHVKEATNYVDAAMNYTGTEPKRGRTKRLYEYWTRLQVKQCA